MALKFNNNNITSVQYNGINLKTVKYNGTIVFQSAVSNPAIGAITTTYNSASFSVTNTSLYSVNLKVTVNGYTQTKAAGAVGTATQTQNFSFNNASHGLTSNVTYSVVAYAEFGAMLSGNANSSFKTLVEYTKVPIIVSVSQTWDTISWKLKNDDSATVTIKTQLYDASQNNPIEDEKTISLAPNGEYTFSQSGLSYSTDYYIKRTALANDGKLEPTYVTTGPYATTALPTTASPGYQFISSNYNSITFRLTNNEPVKSAKIYYRIGPTGSWTQYGGSSYLLPPESYTNEIVATTDGNGAGLTANTTYSIYRYALVPDWNPSTPVYTNASTAALSTMSPPNVTSSGATTNSITANIYNPNGFIVKVYTKVDNGTYTELGDLNGWSSTTKSYSGFAEGTYHTIYAYFTREGYAQTSPGSVTIQTSVTPTTSAPFNISVVDSSGSTLTIAFSTGTAYETGNIRYDLSGKTGNVRYDSGQYGRSQFTIGGVAYSQYNLNIWLTRDGYRESSSSYYNCLNCIANVTGADSGIGRILIKYRSNPYYVQGIYTSYDGSWNTVVSGGSLGNNAISSAGTNVYVRGKYVYFQLRCRSAQNAGGAGDYSDQVSVTLANPVYIE